MTRIDLRRLPALILLLLIGRSAIAQGTSGMLPDPIAGQDLSRYAERLALSPQQRLAIDRFHVTYLESFKQLREAEIEGFLGEANNMMRRFWTAPDTRAVREALNDFEQLRTKIKRLDEQLFAQVQTVLTEDQSAAMLVVLQRRERERERTGLVRMIGSTNPAARVDLSRLIDGLELSADAARTCEPHVDGYESQLTTATRRLVDACERMVIDMTETMEEQRAAMQTGNFRWDSMRTVMADASKDSMRYASEIASLNRRSEGTLRAVLPPDAAQQLRRTFRSQAYPELGNGGNTMFDRLDALKARTDLDAGQRDAVASIDIEFRSRFERIATELLDVLDEQRRESGAFRFGRPQKNETVTELSARRDTLLRETEDRLVALLGAERLAAADQSVDDATRKSLDNAAIEQRIASGATAMRTRVTGRSTAPTTATAAFAGPDLFLPAPIGRAELEWYGRLLDLDNDQFALLEALHIDYRDRWSEADATHLDPIRSGVSLIATRARNDETAMPTAADVERVYALRAKALAAYRQIDAAFLDDVELTLIEDQREERAARLRAARDRVVYRRGDRGTATSRWRSAPGRSHREADIDLVHLLSGASLDATSTESAVEALDAYERTLAEVLKTQYDIRRAYEQESDLHRVNSFSVRTDGRMDWRAYGERAQQLTDETTRQLAPIHQRLSDLNGTTLEALATDLDPLDARRLRNRYRRATHPEVYDDPTAAEPVFLSALELPELSGEQRASIGEIFADYRATYGQTCEAMAEALEPATANGPGRWQRWRDQRNRLEKLRFERDELNDKTLRQLQSLLSEEQSQRLGLAGR